MTNSLDGDPRSPREGSKNRGDKTDKSAASSGQRIADCVADLYLSCPLLVSNELTVSDEERL